jgi:uncharacterized protein YgiM (DUF1202 family)
LDAIGKVFGMKSTAPAPVAEVSVRTATVIVNAANLRKGSSTATAVLKTLKKGDVLTITGDTTGDWTPVEHEGVAGYVSNDLIAME